MISTLGQLEEVKRSRRFWLARGFILIVFTFNILCAFQFILQPTRYTTSFDLTGDSGAAVIRSIGILFLMWNVPYAIALINPVGNFVALLSAVIMQALGVLGETWVYVTIPMLLSFRQSISRFVIFDAVGLVLLAISLGISWRLRKT